jgi:hypothetical protein
LAVNCLSFEEENGNMLLVVTIPILLPAKMTATLLVGIRETARENSIPSNKNERIRWDSMI